MKFLASHENTARGTSGFPIELYYVDRSHPRYEMPFHWHLEHEIMLVLSGSFSLSVDGKKADYKAFQDTFIMVSLSKGIHEIKFTFYPTGFRFGVGITVVTVLVLSLFLICRYRTSRKRDM